MDNRIKLIRDLTFGDGSIYLAHKNADYCVFSVSHSNEQEKWIRWKKARLDEFGFQTSLYQDKSERMAWRLRIYSDPFFFQWRKEWYKPNIRGDMDKDYKSLIQSAKIDKDTLCILFLDNGCIGIKRSYKDYNYGYRVEIEPYIERFKLSIGLRDPLQAISVFNKFGMEAKTSREYTGNAEIQINRNDSKKILKRMIHEFCLKNDLCDVFSYKYDYPLSMKDVKRLSERTPL